MFLGGLKGNIGKKWVNVERNFVKSPNNSYFPVFGPEKTLYLEAFHAV